MKPFVTAAMASVLLVGLGLWMAAHEHASQRVSPRMSSDAAHGRASRVASPRSPADRVVFAPDARSNPRVPENGHVALSSTERRPAENDVFYQHRLGFLDSFEEFRAKAQLTEAQEQAVLRVMADVQLNFQQAEEDFTRLLLDASASNPGGKAGLDEYMTSRTSVVVLDTLTEELESELDKILDERQMRQFESSFRSTIWVAQLLHYVAPLELAGPRQLTSIR